MRKTALRRHSDSIGTLAGALAKAQIQLVNPEKTMLATIRRDGRGAAEQIFRYAPLSSGLDIVRKTLGQHEIATVQATDIDHAAGIVSVTTTLAHSRPASGSLRIGRFARLTTWRAPGGWERRSPMPGAMLFSHWLALPAKTISMLLISTPPGRQKQKSHG
jgi:hypothetical protein